MGYAIIDTIPKDARNQGSINLGLEIVKNKFNADYYHWTDTLKQNYKQILFNVFYPTHILNISPFLHRNNIPVLRDTRKSSPKLIAGGQGVGYRGLLNGIMDEVSTNEIDFIENQTEIITLPVIKKKKAVIELTRGCKYRCKFCEYSWTHGKYREKPIELVEEQIKYIRSIGIKAVNFLSANFAGYRQIDRLIQTTQQQGVSILNADSCINDIHKLYPYMKILPRYIKCGIESFDPTTRTNIGKSFSDEKLESVIAELLKHAYGIHFYLIYGLPNDNYQKWFQWVKKLADIRRQHTNTVVSLFGEHIRKNTKNIRFELSITNFEPCDKTPLQDVPLVDFTEKDNFIKQWIACLYENGFYKTLNVDYKNCWGRFGRKEHSYHLLMKLKKGGEELTNNLTGIFKYGIHRSILDNQALKFLEQ